MSLFVLLPVLGLTPLAAVGCRLAALQLRLLVAVGARGVGALRCVELELLELGGHRERAAARLLSQIVEEGHVQHLADFAREHEAAPLPHVENGGLHHSIAGANALQVPAHPTVAEGREYIDNIALGHCGADIAPPLVDPEHARHIAVSLYCSLVGNANVRRAAHLLQHIHQLLVLYWVPVLQALEEISVLLHRLLQDLLPVAALRLCV